MLSAKKTVCTTYGPVQYYILHLLNIYYINVTQNWLLFWVMNPQKKIPDFSWEGARRKLDRHTV